MVTNANQGPRARHWCFTMNNYTPEDLDRLSSLSGQVDYLIYGKEVSNTGTPHLQGYVCFRSRKRLSQCVTILGQCHFSVTRCVQASIEYCKKDGEFLELGTPPKGERRINQYDAFIRDVDEGNRDILYLMRNHASVYATCRSFVHEYLYRSKPVSLPFDLNLREWQSTLWARLNRPVEERLIIFIVDRVGNAGKSYFCNHYCIKHDNAQLVIPGRKIDMAYWLDENCRVFLFDCPRAKNGEYIQYDFLEEVKNGKVFSSKFESRIKSFATPHVCVFMNEHPDMSKLSEDRYDVINLS